MPSNKPNKSQEKSSRKSSGKAPGADVNPAEPMSDTGAADNPSMAKKGAGSRKRNARARSSRR